MTRVDRRTLPVPGPEGTFRFPHIAKRALANGLEIRAVSHHAVPVASAVLLVPGGSSADPDGRPGLAALTADLLDEGSGGRGALEVADAVARLGGDLDIEVGPDQITVGLTTLGRFLEPGLGLLAEIATRPNLTDEDFARVRKLRLERLRQLRDHAPAVAERAFARLLYGSHPYGHLGLGTEASLAATTVDELRLFHRALFAPVGATLVIAGDHPETVLLDAAAAAFGGWTAAAEAGTVDRKAGTEDPPRLPSTRLALVPRPGSAQSELRIGQVCASRATPDYHALVMLNTILGGQFVSRVNLKLREEKGYTYGARTGFDLRRGLGPFAFQTSVQTEVTAAAIVEARREIADIRGARPATAAELDTARQAVTRGYPRGFETAQQVARSVAQLALHGLPDSYFEEFVPRVNAVTTGDIERVAAAYLDPERMLTLVVGDQEKIGTSLSILEMGEPSIIEP
ncbi:MAG: M16 family metallopeptidase [Vicinamibacterales bacterium]